MDIKEREFLGVWIPKDIWLTKELSWVEKVLLTEIQSLDTADNHCWASNEYFAEFCDVSTKTISRAIQHLNKLGYIELDYKIDNSRVIKMSIGYRQNVSRLETKCLPNNIDNNIDTKVSNINISNNTKVLFPILPAQQEEVKNTGNVTTGNVLTENTESTQGNTVENKSSKKKKENVNDYAVRISNGNDELYNFIMTFHKRVKARNRNYFLPNLKHDIGTLLEYPELERKSKMREILANDNYVHIFPYNRDVRNSCKRTSPIDMEKDCGVKCAVPVGNITKEKF